MRSFSYKKYKISISGIVIIFSALFVNLHAQCPNIVWSDEFDGTTLDLTKWSYQLGGNGWGNSELQNYTDQNATVSDGTLKITAKAEAYQGNNYTSSRIRSLGKGDFKYGRMEARMKMPVGKGLWPAFWMMPTDNVYGGWPKSGEIDITEYLGQQPATIYGTLHYGQAWPNNSSTSRSFSTQGDKLNVDFHTYAIEWTPTSIKWFIDGYLFSTKTPANLGNQPWIFTERFHFILNMAVGGNWPGSPNASTIFPQTFEVDYVRVYDLTDWAYLAGSQRVPFMGTNTPFSLVNVPQNSTIMWTVPTGATVASGQGTPNARINWGTTSGIVRATVTSPCGTTNHELYVKVEAQLPELILSEPFDYPLSNLQNANAGFGFSSAWSRSTTDAAATLGDDSGNTATIESDNIFGTSGSSNKAKLCVQSGKTTRLDRTLTANTLDGADGTDYWMSFWYKNETSDAETATHGAAAQLLLMGTANSATATEMRLGFGKTNTAGVNLFTIFTRASPSGCNIQNWGQNMLKSSTGTYFVLVKISKGSFTSGTTKFDEVRAWLLDAPPANEAALAAKPNGDLTPLNSTTGLPEAMQTRVLRGDNTANNSCVRSGVRGIRLRVEGGTKTDFCTEFDDIRLGTTFASVTTQADELPVELINFTGKNTNETNQLYWQTANEDKFLGFDVERSTNKNSFERIGTVKAIGSNSTYNFTDNSPTAISYYRLKMLDLNGSFEYSKTIALQSKKGSKVKIYPSITNGSVTIVGATQYEVVNSLGQIVVQNSWLNSETQAELSLSSFPNGLYLVRGLDTEGVVFLSKIVKQ
jgi:beta-glucanase (GH16 family)